MDSYVPTVETGGSDVSSSTATNARVSLSVSSLELNGYRFTAREETAAQSVIELAAGTLDERRFCEFLRANSERA
jgi:prophage maintenance system killer protein